MQNESRPDDLLTKRIAELEAQLADEKRKSDHYANEAAMRASSLNTYLADGTYTDEKQTTWTRPTAYAYAMVCGARNRLEAQLDAAKKDSERLEWIFDILSLTDNDGDAKALSLANQVMRKCAGIVDSPRATIDAARGAK